MICRNKLPLQSFYILFPVFKLLFFIFRASFWDRKKCNAVLLCRGHSLCTLHPVFAYIIFYLFELLDISLPFLDFIDRTETENRGTEKRDLNPVLLCRGHNNRGHGLVYRGCVLCCYCCLSINMFAVTACDNKSACCVSLYSNRPRPVGGNSTILTCVLTDKDGETCKINHT